MNTDMFESIKRDAAPVEFLKTTGLFGATTLGVGAMLGAGIYVLIGLAAAAAGPALWISYTLCGLLTFLTVLVYAEFARHRTASGGGYYYAYDQLGSFWGFMVGWHLAIGSIFACALYARGFAFYSLSFAGVAEQPDWMVRLISGAVVLLLLLPAVRGSRGGDLVGKIFTWGNVAILLVIAVMGFTRFSGDHFTPVMPNGVGGVGTAISIIYISFFGFQLVANNAEEIRDAKRKVPRAMILSLGIAFVVYLVVAVAAIGAAGAEKLGAEHAPLMLLASIGPGPTGAILIGLGGILASAAALNSTLISQGRQLFAMGRDGMLPKLLGAVTRKKRLPAAALLAGGVAAVIVAVAGDVAFIAKSANFALIFAMMPVCIGLHRLYSNAEQPVARWRRVLPILALVANGALLATLDLASIVVGGLVVGAGCAVFLAYSRTSEQRGRSGFSVSLSDRQVHLPLLTGASRILVPLGNPETTGPLLDISCAILPARTGEIVALKVAESTDGTEPRIMLQDQEVTRSALDALDPVTKRARESGTRVRPVLRASRSLSEGIRHTALEENCSLIVMGWTDTTEGTPSSLLTDVVTRSRTDFVFLHMPRKRTFRRIGVALGGMDNLALLVKIAGTLAEQTAGEVSYFNVLPEHFTRDDLEHARNLQTAAIEHHSGLAAYKTELFNTDNPLKAIIDRSQTLDLLLIGSAPLANMEGDSLVGSFSTMIIEKSKSPVIIVRRTLGFGRYIPNPIADMFTFETD